MGDFTPGPGASLVSIGRCFNVGDFRALAQKRLPGPLFHYIDGGAGDEWSLRNNTSAFAKYQLLPSQLRDVSRIDARTTILGVPCAYPLMLAPTAMSRLFHHEKELAVARAAARFGIPYALSTLATTAIEDVSEVEGLATIFQVYIFRDRGLTRDFVERARANGVKALCLTVDTVMAGHRERDYRTGMILPPRLTLASLADFARHPHWVVNYLLSPDFTLANVVHRVDVLRSNTISLIDYVNSQFDRALSWDDVRWLAETWGGPLIIKGVQSPDDARRARAAGAHALMISNHGGRQLEGSAAPVDCVRPIRDAVGDDLELIVDGGVRRGIHVLQALALGANAVSFGRPYLYALAAGGQAGVERMLTLFTAEIERGMTLLGCAALGDISERHLMTM